MIFRRDCRACLQGQMRSHIHRRQKHHGSNTFCLSMDLVGPWRPGKDHLHGQPVTRFLIAALSVPLPGGLDTAKGSEGEEGEGESAEGWEEEEYEQGVEEDLPLGSEGDPSEEEFERRRQRDEEAWRREAATLQEPVPIHDLIFCEPLTSKKSSEVLKAIQYRDWDSQSEGFIPMVVESSVIGLLMPGPWLEIFSTHTVFLQIQRVTAALRIG